MRDSMFEAKEEDIVSTTDAYCLRIDELNVFAPQFLERNKVYSFEITKTFEGVASTHDYDLSFCMMMKNRNDVLMKMASSIGNEHDYIEKAHSVIGTTYSYNIERLNKIIEIHKGIGENTKYFSTQQNKAITEIKDFLIITPNQHVPNEINVGFKDILATKANFVTPIKISYNQFLSVDLHFLIHKDSESSPYYYIRIPVSPRHIEEIYVSADSEFKGYISNPTFLFDNTIDNMTVNFKSMDELQSHLKMIIEKKIITDISGFFEVKKSVVEKMTEEERHEHLKVMEMTKY